MMGYNVCKRWCVCVGVVFCVFCMDSEQIGITGEAFAQWEQRGGRPIRSSAGQIPQHLLEEAQKLVEDERQNATISQNVRERYRSLSVILSGMLRSGSPVREILSRDEGQRVQALMRQGELNEAAERVHDAILRLERVNKIPQDSGTKRFSQKHSMPSPGSDTEVPSEPVFRLNVHQEANKTSFGNILKLMNPLVDSKNRRLYFTGTKSTYLGVIDLAKDELIKTVNIGIPGGFLIKDPKSNDIYMFDIGVKTWFKIELMNMHVSRISSLPPSVLLPEKRAPIFYKGYSYKETGYPFRAGYLQNENASYGVIEIRDSSGNMIDQIKHGPDALYFDIDQKTGRLYTTNSGDGSISIYDLDNNRRKIKDIDVGTIVDEIVLNPKSGGIYIRNRIGGSTIFYYNQKTKKLTTIPNENMPGPKGIGMWPTQIIYDDNKLYVLSHYGGRIDVIDTLTHEVSRRIDLNLSYKPRTDGISTMVMDRDRKILYAAFPELAELAVADANTFKHLKTIQIKGFEMESPGPARIVLALDEKLNSLFVYLPDLEMLYVYDTNTYSLKRSIPIYVGRTEKIMMSNSQKGVLYVGYKILDAESLEEIGTFNRGTRIIAFDNSRDRVYLTDMAPFRRGSKIEKVYEYVGLTLNREWTLSPILSIPSTFDFAFDNNRFYVGYYEPAMVEAFDLTAGQEPTSDRHPPSSRREERLKGGFGPRNGKSGRCGDGICQPIEKETGRCPEDCK